MLTMDRFFQGLSRRFGSWDITEIIEKCSNLNPNKSEGTILKLNFSNDGAFKPTIDIFTPNPSMNNSEIKSTYVSYIAQSGRKVELCFDSNGALNSKLQKLSKSSVNGENEPIHIFGKFYEQKANQDLEIFKRTKQKDTEYTTKMIDDLTVISHGPDKKPSKIIRNGTAIFNKANMSI